MPYVLESVREQLRKITDATDEVKVLDVGGVTYLFYYIAKAFIKLHGRSFANFAWMMGAFICGALEFYRRIIAKYEDGKKIANGDV